MTVYNFNSKKTHKEWWIRESQKTRPNFMMIIQITPVQTNLILTTWAKIHSTNCKKIKNLLSCTIKIQSQRQKKTKRCSGTCKNVTKKWSTINWWVHWSNKSEPCWIKRTIYWKNKIKGLKGRCNLVKNRSSDWLESYRNSEMSCQNINKLTWAERITLWLNCKTRKMDTRANQKHTDHRQKIIKTSKKFIARNALILRNSWCNNGRFTKKTEPISKNKSKTYPKVLTTVKSNKKCSIKNSQGFMLFMIRKWLN